MSYQYSHVQVGGRAALRVTGSFPIAQIGNDGQFLNGLFIQGSGTSPAFYACCADIAPYEIAGAATNATPLPAVPTQGAWISPHLPLLSLAFDRYRMQSLKFIYEPQSTAVISDRLVFAWTDDPSHPFLSSSGVYGQPSLGRKTPSQLQLLVTPDSMPFMPWKRWSLPVPVAQDERFLFSGSAQNGPDQNLINRFACFGAFSCVASTSDATTPVPVIYGILYAQMVLDLFDPVPIVSSVPLMIAQMHEMRNGLRAPSLSSTTVETKVTFREESKTPVNSDDYVLPPIPPSLVRGQAYSLPPPLSSSSSLPSLHTPRR